MDYAQQAHLVASWSFRARVKQALIRVALQQSSGTAVQPPSLSAKVAANLDAWTETVAAAIAESATMSVVLTDEGPTAANTVGTPWTDVDYVNAVGAVWPLLAAL